MSEGKESKMAFSCWKCGKEMPEGSSFCPACSAPVSKEAVNRMETVAGVGEAKIQILPGVLVDGRYQVEKELGRGGMGVVFLARDKSLDELVAMKVLPTELTSSPRAVMELKKELQIARKLNHDHIVRFHHVDDWEGSHFVLMEYVAGQSLDHYLFRKGGQLPLEGAIPILREIASALDYAHFNKPPIVHRDIKPLNILMTSDDHAKVADFGLARVISDSASRFTNRPTAGTLAYMAPEQMRGKGIGTHTDVYAFACLAYECLAGHPPFHTGDLQWQIMQEDPDPIPGQPGWVNEVLLRGLVKKAEDRIGSAGDLVSGLATAPKVDPGADQAAKAEEQRQRAEEERRQKAELERLKQIEIEWEKDKAERLKKEKAERLRKEEAEREKSEAKHLEKISREKRKRKEEHLRKEREAELARQKAKDEEPQREQFETWTDPTTGMEFVKIPGGCFQMGSPESEKDRGSDEGPVHEVCVDGFWLGKYEVTQGQWQAVMGENPSRFKKGDNYPVEKVSWNATQEFFKKLNARGSGRFRLPTEAEWEYACRAGTTTPFHFGETISADTQANYDGNYPYGGGSKEKYRKSTTPVGSFPSNAWGLHDMHGNVWEWVQDKYDEKAYQKHERRNPIYEESGSRRVFRGGSWNDNARYLRCADRGRSVAGNGDNNLGLRVVAASPPGP